MKLNSRYQTFAFFLVLLFTFLFQSCSNKLYRQDISYEDRMNLNPPSMVEKLWLARHQYDEDRRLIVPKVGSARWGAVQEYTADGNLVYRDWWVRNLKVEDLEAAPSMDIEISPQEDDSSRPPVLGISGIEVEENPNPIGSDIDDPFGSDGVSPNLQNVDPFAPLPEVENQPGSTPPSVDPFAPLPTEDGSMTAPIPATEGDPFAPLPSPF